MSSSSQSREWNAAEYHRLSAPQFQWGKKVLGELHLRGDECVLDAGCGTGKLTHLLLENLPRGRVIGLDLSRNMVLHAQQNLRPLFRDHIEFIAADLLHLPFRAAFDGIFSTASFHWVLDHEALFQNLWNALRPGGWLHAQCGGGPNLARVRSRVQVIAQTPKYSRWLGDCREPWFFSDAEGAAARLCAAGFEEVRTDLEPGAFAVSTSQEFQDYLRTFVLHRHLQRLPEEPLRHDFIREIADVSANDQPVWNLDYWRLNLRARRPR